MTAIRGAQALPIARAVVSGSPILQESGRVAYSTSGKWGSPLVSAEHRIEDAMWNPATV